MLLVLIVLGFKGPQVRRGEHHVPIFLGSVLVKLLNCTGVKDLLVLSNKLAHLCLGLVEVERVVSWHVRKGLHL